MRDGGFGSRAERNIGEGWGREIPTCALRY
jgi:hypothetical protein